MDSEFDDLCPALRDTVDLYISGSHEAYVEQVEKYNQNSDVLETANTLKSCTDEKLTPQDKQDTLNVLEPGSKKILMNEEVERMWPIPTVWERILQENSVQPWSS
ncbi:hypothetical protein E5288_WYG014542 [Bos mutus]|uniref:Uncharacterized protein n=2 Tax=Bos mutus TaxID=72004 RepID=A0A6B0R085_9CETA|nr:hypothetical protein [Bos mutus]